VKEDIMYTFVESRNSLTEVVIRDIWGIHDFVIKVGEGERLLDEAEPP
jgi:hypothetical protein